MAQDPEVKEKPPMYTYVGNWVMPRARWDDLEKQRASTDKILDKALSGGTLVGYGDDTTVIHTEDGSTHDNWWSSMSMAGLMKVLEDLRAAGNVTAPILANATKHWDAVYVSHYYNWHSGSRRGAYTHFSSYKLKADAPDDAVDTLSKSFVVPLMERLLADGTLVEYEVDEESIHTHAPGTFYLAYICASADGLDKVNAALGAALKASPFAGPAFGSMVDFSGHRDELDRTDAVYK